VTNLVDATSGEGQRVAVIEYTEIIKTHTDTTTTVRQGLQRYETLDGFSVQREEKGVYRIPSLGNLRVWSDAEDAP
jgi:hypothetical protein